MKDVIPSIPDDLGDCEWNPEKSDYALITDARHAMAEFAVSDLHLCAECAALPRFVNLKRTRLAFI
jgi:hypothetical protein